MNFCPYNFNKDSLFIYDYNAVQTSSHVKDTNLTPYKKSNVEGINPLKKNTIHITG